MKIVEKTFSSQPVPFTFYGQSFSFLSAALLIQVFNRIESVEKAHITTECHRKKVFTKSLITCTKLWWCFLKQPIWQLLNGVTY